MQQPIPIAHYSVRTESPDGVQEVTAGPDRDTAIAVCYRYHEMTGQKVWVVNTRTNETEHRIEREPDMIQQTPDLGGAA